MFITAKSSFPESLIGEFKVEDVRTRLNDIVCEKIQSICEDNKSRLEGYKGDVQLLSKGIFYPHEYFYALKETGQHARIDELRNSDAFYHGYTSSDHFDIESCEGKPTGKSRFVFILKKNVLPSEALKQMVEGLSLMDCTAVCHAIQYLAIQEIWGVEKFNHLFASDSRTPLMIGTRYYPTNPIYRLVVPLSKDIRFQWRIERGDLVYFKNVDLYRKKLVMGVAQGFNTFCVDDESNKFSALGLSADAITHDEICDELVQELNLPPDDLEYLSETTKKIVLGTMDIDWVEQNKRGNYQIDRKTFNKLGGGECILLNRLDAEKITAIANSTLEQARILLNQYYYY